MFNFSRCYKHMSQTYLNEQGSHAQQQCMSSSFSITLLTFDVVSHFISVILRSMQNSFITVLTKVEPFFMFAI